MIPCDEAISRLLQLEFKTILDIGSGDGQHADRFRAAGKLVTEVDLNPSRPGVINQPYENFNLDSTMRFDCLWCCHCLEHQPNVNSFLTKMHNDLLLGGILAITVPPLKHSIVSGHLSLWNGGLLLYNLILARFDCRRAMVKKSGYNITVIVRRNEIKLPQLVYNTGDLARLAPYFPPGLNEGFNGDIEELNWRQA
jgi:SAM-dependent methyltransferase